MFIFFPARALFHYLSSRGSAHCVHLIMISIVVNYSVCTHANVKERGAIDVAFLLSAYREPANSRCVLFILLSNE